MRRLTVALLVLGASLVVLAGSASATVLRVGTYHGIPGQYRTIQTAVDAAKPGDWILVAPGDYKTTRIRTPKGQPDFPAAVLITTRNIHIRGMNRNSVIVDGTKPGSARCSRRTSAQNFGLNGGAPAAEPYGGPRKRGKSGVNGLMVWKASNVSIENLTACNFLGGSRYAGNAIWWNGGADTGKVEGHGLTGAYLTATSTYLKGQSKAGEFSAAQYGIFTSNWSGGTLNQLYGSNFNDSGVYIGACQQICNQTLNHAWMEYNALGYSGSNSGGRLLIENSQFDNNEEGLDTGSLNGDEPAPQNGACPPGVKPPIAGAPTCWVFYRNYVHDNNNPNVPAAGAAAAGPVGSGIAVSGGRYDTIMDNRFVNNDSWAVILAPYLDSGKPCFGGTYGGVFGPTSCVWDDYGNALLNNTFSHNGSYGNPSNGDLGEANLESGRPTNCYSGNAGPAGQPLTPAGAQALQTLHPTCNGSPQAAGSSDPTFLNEVLCDSQLAGTSSCTPTDHYPRVTHIVMHPLPKHLKTMPSPCAGVPANPWCRRGGKG